MASSEYTDVLVLTWTLFGVAFLASVGRFVIRLRLQRKLRWDDLGHGVALLSLVAFDTVYTLMFPPYEDVANFAHSDGPEPSPARIEQYFRLAVAMQFLLWVVIYSVKITFLLFYYQIFSISRPFLIAWRIIMAYVVLTFLASFLTPFWTCGNPLQLFQLDACLSPAAGQATNTYPPILVGLNVAGDVAVMGLPLFMLRTLRVSLPQKLGLAGIFLLGCVTIACDIVRVDKGNGGSGTQVAFVWDIIEPNLGVIMSALPTFRGMFLPAAQRRGASSYRSIQPSNRSASGLPPKSHQGSSYRMRDSMAHLDTTTSTEEFDLVTELPKAYDGAGTVRRAED